MPIERIGLAGVSKSFGSIKALRDLTLDFERGKIHALLGENGSGKSTTVQILSGATAPDRGAVTFDGARRDLASPREAIGAGIATAFQHSALVEQLTVGENVLLGHERTRFGLIGAQ